MARQRRTMIGRVVSDKMQKTVIVAVESHKRDRLYGKTLRTLKKYMAHDEDGSSHEGDLVRIMETPPISKSKRWMVVEIVETQQ